MGSIPLDELIRLARHGDFPGSKPLLAWLRAHPHADAQRADIPQDAFTSAAEARKLWEIREKTAKASGAATGHMRDAIDALRALESVAPTTPVVVTTIEDENRMWIVFSAGDQARGAFWVHRRGNSNIE